MPLAEHYSAREAALSVIETYKDPATYQAWLDAYPSKDADTQATLAQVFGRAKLQAALDSGAAAERFGQMVLLQADVTANDDADVELLNGLNVLGLPTLIFFDRAGKAIRNACGFEQEGCFGCCV